MIVVLCSNGCWLAALGRSENVVASTVTVLEVNDLLVEQSGVRV